MLKLKNIKGDIYGGITAGVIALPLALALGVASGLGASAGLWGAVIVCLFATILGGTPTQISGPTGPMTVVVASVVLSNPNNPLLVFTTIFLAGFFQIIFGFLKAGKAIKFMPYPVISGFMSGIGAIIVLLQLNPLIGQSFEGTPIQNLKHFIISLQNTNLQSLMLGILTLLIVFFTPKKVQSKIPAPLLALIIITLCAVVFNLDVKTIGDIPASFPQFSFAMPSFDVIRLALPLAMTLALLGSIDSLLTSLVADSITRTKHNSNRELLGQGLGNMAAALFGGLAGAGATMRTVINIKSGGNSRFSGVVHSIFLILVVLCFAPAASKIPMAVLAGILVKVGFDIIDYKFLKLLKAAPKSDLAVMITVFLVTVLDNLIFAVGLGIVLASLLFAIKAAKQMEVDITDVSDGCLEEECSNRVLILHIDGIFFFGTASQVLSRIEHLPETEFVIIDCSGLKTVDISAAFALEDMILRLTDNGIKVLLIVNEDNLKERLINLGVENVLPSECIVKDKTAAMERVKNSL